MLHKYVLACWKRQKCSKKSRQKRCCHDFHIPTPLFFLLSFCFGSHIPVPLTPTPLVCFCLFFFSTEPPSFSQTAIFFVCFFFFFCCCFVFFFEPAENIEKVGVFFATFFLFLFLHARSLPYFFPERWGGCVVCLGAELGVLDVLLIKHPACCAASFLLIDCVKLVGLLRFAHRRCGGRVRGVEGNSLIIDGRLDICSARERSVVEVELLHTRHVFIFFVVQIVQVCLLLLCR